MGLIRCFDLKKKTKLALVAALFSVPCLAHSSPESCEAENSNYPLARDTLKILNTAEYDNPDYVGVNRSAVLTSDKREISCQFSQPRAHVKCYKVIRLTGRAAEGQQLRIPEGALINVSRISHSTDEIYLYPRLTEGLIRTRSGTFRLNCYRYVEDDQPGKVLRVYDHRSLPCFNNDLDLLFENVTERECEDTSESLNQTDLIEDANQISID